MRRLLVVDDLPIIVDGLLELFQSTEHLELDVLKAYSGEEALRLMREGLRSTSSFPTLKCPDWKASRCCRSFRPIGLPAR